MAPQFYSKGQPFRFGSSYPRFVVHTPFMSLSLIKLITFLFISNYLSYNNNNNNNNNNNITLLSTYHQTSSLIKKRQLVPLFII